MSKMFLNIKNKDEKKKQAKRKQKNETETGKPKEKYRKEILKRELAILNEKTLPHIKQQCLHAYKIHPDVERDAHDNPSKEKLKSDINYNTTSPITLG